MFGIALILGGSRPVKMIAGVFLVIGCWLGATEPGEQVVTWLDHLARSCL